MRYVKFTLLIWVEPIILVVPTCEKGTQLWPRKFWEQGLKKLLLQPIEDWPEAGKSAIFSEKLNLPSFLHIVHNLEHFECYNILMVKIDEGLTTHTRMINFQITNIREILLNGLFLPRKVTTRWRFTYFLSPHIKSYPLLIWACNSWIMFYMCTMR